MQQAFEHEAACGCLGDSDKPEGERKQENTGGKETDWMTDRTEHTTAITIYNHAMVLSRFSRSEVTNGWGKRERKTRLNDDEKLTLLRFACSVTMPQTFLLVFFKPCFLATPARSNMRAAPGAGAIHPGVPPAHGRQHRTQIRSTATAL